MYSCCCFSRPGSENVGFLTFFKGGFNFWSKSLVNYKTKLSTFCSLQKKLLSTKVLNIETVIKPL